MKKVLFYVLIENKLQPDSLIPFNVRQKQERRQGIPNEDKVSFIRYIEINVYNTQYRLIQKTGSQFSFLVNGVSFNPPFSDVNQVTVIATPNRLKFNTLFGLSINWDGNMIVDVTLCDSYRTYVCGLCGNADSKYFFLIEIFNK